uniref:Ig-like domain-containing protein n=1 Tax=Hymenolepis diminuta TaxID=6216 RepID=A0A0R3SDI1_HYMDI
LASLYLAKQGKSYIQQEHNYEAPVISMGSVSAHWLNIQCTVPKSASAFRVFIHCPALQSPCYENCLPTQTCSDDSSVNEECLPDRTAVNCTESTTEDGSKVTSLWIDKRSTRLHGSWICTSQGIKSIVVNVLPELEEKGTTISNIEPPMINETETEQQKSEDMENAAGSTEVTVKPPLYMLTLRRKNYNEDQKLLGDMVCLPTQISRPHSGLWESDVYPTTLMDNMQEPPFFKGTSNRCNHFGTFGPSNFAYNHSQMQNVSEFSEMVFPQYFNTMQPNQLWRARSVGATFSPGNFPINSGRVSHIRSDAGSLKHLNSLNDSILPSPPPNLILNPMNKASEDLKRFPRITMNPAPTSAAVYDDVASSSTLTINSKEPKKSNSPKNPILPNLVEFEKSPKSTSKFSNKL